MQIVIIGASIIIAIGLLLGAAIIATAIKDVGDSIVVTGGR